MACNFNIKVVEQNDFTICIPLKKRTFVASTPIDEDVDILALDDLSVKIGGAVFLATRDAAGVMVDVSRDALARGTYDVVLTATYRGHAIKAAYFDSLTIVEWNCQSDAQQCVQGSPIMFEAGFVIYNLTDAELAALKEEYRLKIAAAQRAKEEADAAKEEYIAKAEALDDVAQQSTLTQGVQDIREDISHIDIDTSNLAKEAQVKDGNDTAISVGKEVRSEVGTGSDTAAESGTLFAVLKWVKDKVKSIYDAVTDNANGLGAISTKMNAVVSLIVDKTIEGVTLFDPVPLSFLGITSNRNKVAGIEDDTIVKLECTERGLLYTLFPACKVITLNNCIYYGGQSFFIWSDSVEEIYLPEVVEVKCAYSFHRAYHCGIITIPKCTSITGGDAFSYCDALQHLNILSLNSGFSNLTLTSPNLIDLETGAGFTGNVNINSWSPTNALSASSQTLLTPEDIAAGFTSNLQKLLYNIREHIAANMPVAPNTITFSSAVKAAILADQTTADAFTNKGWTIA